LEVRSSLPDRCPRCDGVLERGRLSGQAVYLTWVPEGHSVGVLTIGKEHLATGSLFRPPMLAAARCRACGLGVFEDQG
jgi:hypothetical protein